MSSVTGIRLGLCLLRYGTQPGLPAVFLCRKSHSVTEPKSTNSGKLSSCCGMSTVASQKNPKPFTVDLSELSEEMNIAGTLKRSQRFIMDPELVNKLLYSLDPWDHRTTPIIMECNPGPGVFTRALLDAGCNVVALESNQEFLPGLKKLEANTGDQLRAFHCDFFRLDPWTDIVVQAPSMYSNALMDQLGITEVPWLAGIPLKVFGILNHKKERALMWRYIYFLYQRLSIFSYGRIELNFLMSEQLYKGLSSKPGDFKLYQALTVVCNIACDIQLLCKVPISTFYAPNKIKKGSSGDDLCLVRITPRRNLFSENFTPLEGQVFIHMIKQYLVSRKSRLLPKIECWAQGNGELLLQNLHLPADVRAGDISPEQYKCLFQIMKHSEDYNPNFLFSEF